ncbi:hypothetical protein QR680_017932 [Steinernema hermaphroditum]|uniref:Uncharacterized protein n=1 Tax=Steinernema hermaphroditum TaxID=289476 RepID=A0AA39HIJ4_9BILA|nr:hypothetical protein QR680_017932 [Steinernema hermaphroditum]
MALSLEEEKELVAQSRKLILIIMRGKQQLSATSSALGERAEICRQMAAECVALLMASQDRRQCLESQLQNVVGAVAGSPTSGDPTQPSTSGVDPENVGDLVRRISYEERYYEGKIAEYQFRRRQEEECRVEVQVEQEKIVELNGMLLKTTCEVNQILSRWKGLSSTEVRTVADVIVELDNLDLGVEEDRCTDM